MKTLVHFKEFCDEIRTSASRKFKQEVLTKYKDDEVIQKYLKINYDPYCVYGLSTKKLTKKVRVPDFFHARTVFELFDYLTEHNTGTDLDVAACQEMLYVASELDVQLEYILMDLICKDLSTGVDSKTINAVMPGLIPTFNVMLAEKYFDKPERVDGKEFAITTKIDGGRIIALKEDGKVSFYTRAGQRYEGLVDLEEAFMNPLFPDNICFDGEITLLNDKGIPSKEAYKQAMKITRKDGEKHGVKMKIFDVMSATDFRAQQCQHTWTERRLFADNLFYAFTTPYFELLPVLYKGTDTSMITKYLDEAIAADQEGVMINICDAPYEFKRTRNLLKCKKFDSLDLEVIGMEEGSGRLAGTLGAVLVRYKGGNTVRVGSGFSDEERRLYWSQPGLIMNKVAEIKYFEESSSGDQLSLRFPTWCSNIRTDKLTPDY